MRNPNERQTSSSTEWTGRTGTIALSPKAKKCVHFSPQCIVFPTLHIKDYSEKEIKETWYSTEERSEILDDVRETLSIMVANGRELPSNPWFCTRGLEARTPEGAGRKRKNKRDALDAVLDEQEYQWNRGISDPEAIADAYCKYSHSCRVSAVMQGKCDENHALDEVDVSAVSNEAKMPSLNGRSCEVRIPLVQRIQRLEISSKAA